MGHLGDHLRSGCEPAGPRRPLHGTLPVSGVIRRGKHGNEPRIWKDAKESGRLKRTIRGYISSRNEHQRCSRPPSVIQAQQPTPLRSVLCLRTSTEPSLLRLDRTDQPLLSGYQVEPFHPTVSVLTTTRLRPFRSNHLSRPSIGLPSQTIRLQHSVLASAIFKDGAPLWRSHRLAGVPRLARSLRLCGQNERNHIDLPIPKMRHPRQPRPIPCCSATHPAHLLPMSLVAPYPSLRVARGHLCLCHALLTAEMVVTGLAIDGSYSSAMVESIRFGVDRTAERPSSSSRTFMSYHRPTPRASDKPRCD